MDRRVFGQFSRLALEFDKTDVPSRTGLAERQCARLESWGSGRACEQQEIRLTGDVPRKQWSCVNLCVNNFGNLAGNQGIESFSPFGRLAQPIETKQRSWSRGWFEPPSACEVV